MKQPTIQTENYTLYHADCLDVLPTLAAGSVDAFVTDPFYGVNGSNGTENLRRAKANYTNEFSDTPSAVRSVCVPAIEMLNKICERGAVTPGNRCFSMYPAPQDLGAFITPAGSGLNRWGRILMQPIFYYGRDPRLGLTIQDSSYTVKLSPEKVAGFPCPKEIESWTWLVNKVAISGDTVIDTFMGSGQTGIACAHLGLKFIGVEIGKQSFNIAAARIANAYGDLTPTPAEKASPQMSLLEALA